MLIGLFSSLLQSCHNELSLNYFAKPQFFKKSCPVKLSLKQFYILWWQNFRLKMCATLLRFDNSLLAWNTNAIPLSLSRCPVQLRLLQSTGMSQLWQEVMKNQLTRLRPIMGCGYSLKSTMWEWDEVGYSNDPLQSLYSEIFSCAYLPVIVCDF